MSPMHSPTRRLARPQRGLIRLYALLGLAAFALPFVLAPTAHRALRPVVLSQSAALPSDAIVSATPIKHVVIIMQENRSFDEYFGTFPNADGIPAGTCVPGAKAGDPCVAPYHDARFVNQGGPHGGVNAFYDTDHGKMDGFVQQAKQPDVMGYHDAREIPNYWTYAQNYVLQDHLFEPNKSWSLISHQFMVSGWNASCAQPDDPFSCHNNFNASTSNRAWTDITYLLHKHNVSWRYYVFAGTQPDTDDDSAGTPVAPQTEKTVSIWNPLPGFSTVKEDGELGNIQDISNFYTDAQNGTLPAVTWILPNYNVSEHPASSIAPGQTYVTGLINAIMQGPNWNSTAIFVAWDDWGGFYDHVPPPAIDLNGYGLRVPGFMVSPYAKKGYIDTQTLCFDAYLKFIEDNFLGGQRLDPATDGRPDPRPTVRESVPQLGDLMQEFDFTQSPRPPLVLSVHPAPGPASNPPGTRVAQGGRP